MPANNPDAEMEGLLASDLLGGDVIAHSQAPDLEDAKIIEGGLTDATGTVALGGSSDVGGTGASDASADVGASSGAGAPGPAKTE